MSDTTGTRASQIKAIDKQGNGSKLLTVDGSFTSGHMVVIDSSGKGIDGGAPSAGAGTPVTETPSGTLNGSNVTFTISNTPSPSASFELFLNGVFQRPSIDYTISGATITYTVAPKSSDTHTARYTH